MMLKPGKSHSNNLQAFFKSWKWHLLALTEDFGPTNPTFSQLFLLQWSCKDIKYTAWPTLQQQHGSEINKKLKLEALHFLLQIFKQWFT